MPRIMRQGDLIRRAALQPTRARIVAHVRAHRTGVVVELSIEERETRHEAVLGRGYVSKLAWNAVLCPALSVGAVALGYEFLEVTP